MQLPEAGQSISTTLRGEAGQLQAVLTMPRQPQARGVSVVCHPHPLHSGTMDNKVVTTVAQSAREAGCAALRFNFRGVGNSEGIHDGGAGEVDDVLSAVRFAESVLPDVPLLLAGFSFGGAMALRAAYRHRPAQLTTIAPALNYWNNEPVESPGCSWLLVHGDADDVVDCEDTQQRARQAEPPPDIRIIPGVGHFFHGELRTLREIITPALEDAISA